MSVAIGRNLVEPSPLAIRMMSVVQKAHSGLPIRMDALGTSVEAGDALEAAEAGAIPNYFGYMFPRLNQDGINAVLAGRDISARGGATIADQVSIDGIGGRQLTKAIAKRPDVVFIGSPLNDSYGTGIWTTEQMSAMVTSMINIAKTLVANGILPVLLFSHVPAASGDAANWIRYSRIMARWCEWYGVPNFMLSHLICRPQDGTSPAAYGYTQENTHLNTVGARIWGEEVARSFAGVLSGRTGFNATWLCHSRADEYTSAPLVGANIIINGCFTNASTGLADTTNGGTSGSGCTLSATLNASSQPFAGSWLNLTRSSSTGDYRVDMNILNWSQTGVTVESSILRLGRRIKATTLATGSSIQTGKRDMSVSLSEPYGRGLKQDLTSAAYFDEWTPVAGSTYGKLEVTNLADPRVAAATGVISFASCACVVLTLIDDFLKDNCGQGSPPPYIWSRAS